jgi:hypothetical protein
MQDSCAGAPSILYSELRLFRCAGLRLCRDLRQSLAIESGQSLRGEDVMQVLSRLKEQRGAPKVLFCTNGASSLGEGWICRYIGMA